MTELPKQIAEATAFIRSKTDLVPRIGIILGTGMGALANAVSKSVVLSYSDIPHFPVSTVESHAGNLHLGILEGVPVMMMQGRFHVYEGYTMKQVTFPVRVMKALGCTMMIVMNATGSMNPFVPRGSIALIADHINLMGDNPLIGPNDDELGPRFPDMSQPYSRELMGLAEEVALDLGIRIHQCVMIAVTGPCLETPAEYRFFRRVGADLVTMSTVPEVIVANHAGLKVLGISVVTDECMPDALKPADIREIIATASSAEPRLTALVSGILARLRA
jgi:purine-nucleoside phosphorylase